MIANWNDMSGNLSERSELVGRLLADRIVAICRMEDSSEAVGIARALEQGGVTCMEITMNTPNALHAISEIAEDTRGVVVGAGTVLDGETARQAILSRAEFLVTPTVQVDVIRVARRYSIPVIAGAMTPTEVLAAWEAGADFVKIFPASVLKAQYIKALRGPLPQVRLAPTGGITAKNAGEYIRAGASLVCIGGALVDRGAIKSGDFEELTRRAREVVAAVRGNLEGEGLE